MLKENFAVADFSSAVFGETENCGPLSVTFTLFGRNREKCVYHQVFFAETLRANMRQEWRKHTSKSAGDGNKCPDKG